MRTVILLVSLLCGIEAQDTCYYPYHCDVSDESLILNTTTVENGAEDCKAKCEEWDGAECQAYRWNDLASANTCFLMTQCNEGGRCRGSLELSEFCKSGPVDCAEFKTCDQLVHEPGQALWVCPGVDAYTQDIVQNTVCSASCDGWYDENGHRVEAQSTCLGGEEGWSSVTYKNGGRPAYPDQDVNPPNEQSKCGPKLCREDFKLWYNPNAEAGALFVCEQIGASETEVAANDNVITIPPTDNCFLFCDNYLAADIACRLGEWTDLSPGVLAGTEGIGCYDLPGECGDNEECPGSGTTEPPTDSPTEPPTDSPTEPPTDSPTEPTTKPAINDNYH